MKVKVVKWCRKKVKVEPGQETVEPDTKPGKEAVSGWVKESVQKLDESESGQMVSEKKWNEHNLMYIFHKKINETAQTAHINDFPLIFCGNGPK